MFVIRTHRHRKDPPKEVRANFVSFVKLLFGDLIRFYDSSVHFTLFFCNVLSFIQFLVCFCILNVIKLRLSLRVGAADMTLFKVDKPTEPHFY